MASWNTKLKSTSIISIAILIYLLNCGHNNNENIDDNNENLRNSIFAHNNIDREYKFYKPQNLEDNAPVLFVLHGLNQLNDWSYNLGFNDLADKYRFAVAYPQATTVSKNQEDETYKASIYWNVANDETIFNEINDVSFLSELAKYLQNKHNLNPDKTFVTGFSNGGFMSQTLACQASDVFKGVASVAALMINKVYNECNPVDPVPVLHIHGTMDMIVPISGLINTKNGLPLPPNAQNMIELWAEINHCTSMEIYEYSENVTMYIHKDGINGNQVHYYKLIGNQHLWPGIPVDKEGYQDTSGINATEVIWNFFSKY